VRQGDVFSVSGYVHAMGRAEGMSLTMLAGDQYVQKKPQLSRQKNGEHVIVDGTRTLQALYNLYYW
jgi:hypothetical protein